MTVMRPGWLAASTCMHDHDSHDGHMMVMCCASCDNGPFIVCIAHVMLLSAEWLLPLQLAYMPMLCSMLLCCVHRVLNMCRDTVSLEITEVLLLDYGRVEMLAIARHPLL